METLTQEYKEITNKIKENLPSKETIENIVKENEKVLSVAGGAFLAVVGLKFAFKTVGFLALVGGAALVYRGITSYPNVKGLLNKIAAPDEPKF